MNAVIYNGIFFNKDNYSNNLSNMFWIIILSKFEFHISKALYFNEIIYSNCQKENKAVPKIFSDE